MAEYRTHRGRFRSVLSVVITALATLATLNSGAPLGVKVLLLVIIALVGYRRLARHSVHEIRLEPAASPSLNGVRGTLSAEAATGLFVALLLTPVAGRVRRAFIFRDELEPGAWRALLVFLRHG